MLFKYAYLKAAVPLTAINEFLKTGIVPFDVNMFGEWYFVPSLVTAADDMSIVHEAYQSIEIIKIEEENGSAFNKGINKKENEGRKIHEFK